ncbi:hypothetical protein [Streptomyces sp. NPDC005799]|uniref:hypothetical protein n=1 Tax=Streptomyces sp. NPDC005799 TaxID=3154678 RepID=UPI0033F4C033
MAEKPHITGRSKRPARQQGEPATLAERTLDFIALLGLLAAVTTVFILAGPQAFAAVTSAGTGLFAAWRGHRRRD